MTHHALFVCTSCAFSATQRDHLGHRGGYHLFQQLQQLQQQGHLPPDFTLEAVECLSACRRFCVIALAAPKKMTLMFGDLPALDSTPAIVQLAAQYAARGDGMISRRDRPALLQKGILARIPPLLAP
ncbi:MAG: putative metal-binding protein [Phormidesmis priestleyi Ana]|uniref:Putative metal-binding protein n=1 Tax=Phormidesmis priestleyi Ana TaxID=1666911 RepID=A0A0P8D626_9CYAN|nr:MAG: putative metal-binding protein [Phormidesmis priestleyi Ana]